MTEILAGVSPLEGAAGKSRTPERMERAAIRELVEAARARGDELTGPDGLLKSITKQVLETALAEEMSEHLGYVQFLEGGPRRGGGGGGCTGRRSAGTRSAGSPTRSSSR